MASLFPGGKLLFDTRTDSPSCLEDLLKEARKTNLSGFCEVTYPQAIGIVVYYSGEAISVIFKAQGKLASAAGALAELTEYCHKHRGGRIAVYELPNEVAFMLRGLTNRKLISSDADWSGHLRLLIEDLVDQQYTGALDVITTAGKGLILLVNGKFSTVIFEMEKGIAVTGKSAIEKMYEVMDKPGVTCKVYQSDFSSEIWKERHVAGIPRETRVHQIMVERVRDMAEETGVVAASGTPSSDAEPMSKEPQTQAQTVASLPPGTEKAAVAAAEGHVPEMEISGTDQVPTTPLGSPRSVLVEFSRQLRPHLAYTCVFDAQGKILATAASHLRFQEARTLNLLAMLADAGIKTTDLLDVGDLEDLLVLTDTDYIVIKRIADGKYFHALILKREGNLTQARLLMAQFEHRIVQALSASSASETETGAGVRQTP